MSAAGATPPAAARVRTVVLALVAALCLVLAAWHVARYSAHTAALALTLLLVPWALPLRGLREGNRRTYAGATLLTLPYLCYGLMETLANPGARAFAAATVLLAFAIFVALVAYLRVSRPTAPEQSARTAP